MRKIAFVLFPSLFGLSAAGFAQAPDTLWTKTYGGQYNESAFSIQQTTDGGFIVAGYTYTFGPGNYDVYLLRTDPNGDTLWTRTYGGTDGDYGYSVRQTTDGGYIIAGQTESFGQTYNDVYLIKTDNSGDTVWTRTYDAGSYEAANSVKQTDDGGFIIAGYIFYVGTQNRDFFLVKTDVNGDTMWTRIYGGSEPDEAWSVIQASDGGYVVAGYTASFGSGNEDIWLLKTDANGDTVWTKIIGGNGIDDARDIQQTTDGGYIVAGSTDSYGSGELYLIKTDADGNTQWARRYGGHDYDYGNCVRQTSDGGFVATGYTWVGPDGWYDVFLVKTNENGNTMWTASYGGSQDEHGHSVLETSDGGYVIAGATRSYGEGAGDVWLIKVGGEWYEPVPTLSEWGMIIMALILLAFSTVAIIRRRGAAYESGRR